MKIKNTAAAILAAAAMTAAATAWAVDAAPASVPQFTENAQPQIGMSAATAAAEEAYDGQTRLHMSREYGPVWDVRMVKADGTDVRAFVDAQTGKIVAADEFGIGEGRRMHDGRGYGHRGHDRGDCGFGFGHGFGFHGGRACW